MLSNKHTEAEFLLFENYSHSSFILSSKKNWKYSKKYAKEQVSLYLWDHTINHDEKEDNNEK